MIYSFHVQTMNAAGRFGIEGGNLQVNSREDVEIVL